MDRSELLELADQVVNKDRCITHGKPEDSFLVISRLWSAYLEREIKPHHVAQMMILLKLARMKSNPINVDNWVDIAGYAACGAELVKAVDLSKGN